jgi:radical SAM protein with 4Fe4S-binding SPASM domain
VLFVDVHVTGEGVTGLPGLAAGLAEGPEGRIPRLALTVAGSLLAEVIGALGPGRLAGVEVNLLPPHPEAGTFAGPVVVAASVWSTPEGLRAFPSALALAARLGLKTVTILNPAAPAEHLGPKDRDRAAVAWQAAGLKGRSVLRCHDLFLAGALGLAPFEGYAGCQAAAFLAHVDVDGRLVACRTLAAPLGDLVVTPLAELWASPERQRLRGALESAPGSCGSCGLVTCCRGGCRGLAADLGRDPSCPGVREVREVEEVREVREVRREAGGQPSQQLTTNNSKLKTQNSKLPTDSNP